MCCSLGFVACCISLSLPESSTPWCRLWDHHVTTHPNSGVNWLSCVAQVLVCDHYLWVTSLSPAFFDSSELISLQNPQFFLDGSGVNKPLEVISETRQLPCPLAPRQLIFPNSCPAGDPDLLFLPCRPPFCPGLSFILNSVSIWILVCSPAWELSFSLLKHLRP